MKTQIKHSAIVALTITMASCATADFHQYTGVQQNWPTIKRDVCKH